MSASDAGSARLRQLNPISPPRGVLRVKARNRSATARGTGASSQSGGGLRERVAGLHRALASGDGTKVAENARVPKTRA
ncbi:MAG TPA: hypothetical protein VD970_06065 [Acetobacteraceae bacterium]|nr:hypothetical protein [Acetobacteraceae bacterium]